MKKNNKIIIVIIFVLILSLCSIKINQEKNIISNKNNYLTQQTTKTIYIIEGDESSTSGDGTESNPYQSIEYAVKQANNGDTIVLLEDIIYRQPAANVNFIINKNITINGNGNLLSFRGSNLELLSNVEFKNLTLNIIPDGSSTTKIYASGNEVTFDNVSTLISQAQSSERPTIIGGSAPGSVSGSHTKINILNGSSETRFKEIIAGNENSDSSTPVTINISSEYSKVDNGINLGGSGNYKVTGTVNLITNSKNIKKITATNSTNNTVTITDSTIYNMELTDIQNLVLKNNAEVTLNNLYKIKENIDLKSGTALWINTPGELEFNNLKGTGELIISTETNLLIKGNIVDSANIKLNGFESDLINNLNKVYVEVNGTINPNINVSIYSENEYYLLNKEDNQYRLIENNGFDKTNIKKIEINKKPNKLTYTAGDTIDISGLILKLTDINDNTILVDYTNIEDYNITYTPKSKLTINDTAIIFQVGTIKTNINITVNEKTTTILDSSKYTPTIANQTIKLNKKIDAKSFITNTNKLPNNTIYSFENEPNFSSEGKQSIVIIITYPDKSQTKLRATLTITSNPVEEETQTPEIETNPEEPNQGTESKDNEEKEEIRYNNEEEKIINQKEEKKTKETTNNKRIIILILLLITLLTIKIIFKKKVIKK